MRSAITLRSLAFAALLSLGAPALASVPLAGTFMAQQGCPAYVSKNNRTNPDQQTLKPGGQYPVFEANTANNPQWYRIRLPEAAPPERWVQKSCGELQVAAAAAAAAPGPAGPQCSQAQGAESHVLALSWQPAFCETEAGRARPECGVTDPGVYQARSFTLHGLWPNRPSQCRIDGYGWCGTVRKQPPGGMCAYPQVPLSDVVRQDLAGVMPSVTAGSCLERHEWWRHGACTGLTPDAYYGLAAALTRQFNQAGPAEMMAANLGGTVSVTAFFKRLDEAFGPDTRNLIRLHCTDGNLTDVEITLPRDIQPGEGLAQLIGRADKGTSRARSNCGNTFRVDAIGQ